MYRPRQYCRKKFEVSGAIEKGVLLPKRASPGLYDGLLLFADYGELFIGLLARHECLVAHHHDGFVGRPRLDDLAFFVRPADHIVLSGGGRKCKGGDQRDWKHELQHCKFLFVAIRWSDNSTLTVTFLQFGVGCFADDQSGELLRRRASTEAVLG